MNRSKFDWSKKPSIPKGVSPSFPFGNPTANDNPVFMPEFSKCPETGAFVSLRVVVRELGLPWHFGRSTPSYPIHGFYRNSQPVPASSPTAEQWKAASALLSSCSIFGPDANPTGSDYFPSSKFDAFLYDWYQNVVKEGSIRKKK